MDEVGYVGFSTQRMEMLRNGWLQARYYSDDDSVIVRDYLSYNDVYEVNPFEIGAARRKERSAFKQRLAKVIDLLAIKDLLPRAFVSLSNGETRRVLLARELLKDPKTLVLDDAFNGLDPYQCERLETIIAKLETDGITVIVKGPRPKNKLNGCWTCAAETCETKPVVEINSITVKFGRRYLFKDFSWRIGQGERWVLRGHNGSGKTTLMALITGDSPLAYGLDVRVFGVPREVGTDLNAIRKRIAMVSPEMQAYLNKNAAELLAEALSREPELLILDEPCMNLSLSAAKKLCRTVAKWLKQHPKTTAICIAHCPEHVPHGFNHELNLDELA